MSRYIDTFYALPSSSSVSLVLDSPSFIVDTISPIIEYTSVLSPIIPIEPLFPVVTTVDTTFVPAVTTVISPYSGTFYYDSGIGTNPLSQHEINDYLRKKFLDHALVDEHEEILSMLKVNNGVVSVDKDNGKDSKDSEDTIKKKINFISSEILTFMKNMKVLKAIIEKNYHLKFYDLPHNQDLVFNTQAKYVKKKLREMKK